MITSKKVSGGAGKLKQVSKKTGPINKKVSNDPNLVQKQPKRLNKAGDTRGTADFGKHGFKPGQSGNPGGKPVGSRNRLQGDFMREMADDFAEHGKTAIIACRTEKPDVYVKVIASLMPRELEIKQPLDDLSEDELIAGVAALQAFLGGSKADKATHH